MAEVDEKTLQAVTSLTPLPNPNHTALRDFTRKVVEEKGWVAENDVQQFLAAGYSRTQVFEVVMGVTLKTFTNNCNHLAGAEPNPEFIMMAEGRNVA